MSGTSDEWTNAVVEIVSSNGRSVGLSLEGLVRARNGYIGSVLPLLVDADASIIRGLDGTEYDVESLL